jgi:carbon starvation protein
MTASWEKVWHSNPRIGFLAHARYLSGELAAGQIIPAKSAEISRLIFNDRLDAVVTIIFATMALIVFLESGRHWCLYAFGGRSPILNEAPVVFSNREP